MLMTAQIDSQTFEEQALVVAFSDLTGFWRFSRARPAPAVISTLAAYYELVGDLVEEAGGRVVKFMGDAGLLIYPVAAASKRMWGQSTVGRWAHARRSTSMSLGKQSIPPRCCRPMGSRLRPRSFGNWSQ